jgi:hypothetical protein
MCIYRPLGRRAGGLIAVNWGLYTTSSLSLYEDHMIDNRAYLPSASCAVTMSLLLGLGIGLAGCAGMSDSLSGAFVDPAKYDLFDCKQLQDTRKELARRAAELQGLMAKADTGVAGPFVAEVAYRNDYISTRAQSKLADEVWERDKCVAVPDKPVAAATAAPTPLAAKREHRKGAAVPPRGGGGE